MDITVYKTKNSNKKGKRYFSSFIKAIEYSYGIYFLCLILWFQGKKKARIIELTITKPFVKFYTIPMSKRRKNRMIKRRKRYE